MKLPTGIRVLCLDPKKKEEITSISTLSLTVHCLAQRKNLENIQRPICWQFVKYLETHFGCRSFISTPSQFRKGLQRVFKV